MTDRIEAAGLQVAPELKAFVADEALPGTGIDGHDFWAGLSNIVHDLAPKNRALLDKRDAYAGQDRRLAPRATAAPIDLAAYKAFLKEIGYLVAGRPGLQGDDEERRPGDRDHRRAAARRAGDECALCAERRQCPLGLALRCALRHRRDSRDRRRRARQGLQSEARREGHRLGARLPRRGRAARRRRLARRARFSVAQRQARRALDGRQHDRAEPPEKVRRLSRRRPHARASSCCSNNGIISRC